MSRSSLTAVFIAARSNRYAFADVSSDRPRSSNSRRHARIAAGDRDDTVCPLKNPST